MAFTPRINETTGKPCCMKTLADGRRKLPSAPCPKCAKHFGRPAPRAASLRTNENITVPDYTPPNAYSAALAKIREETATPMSRFEDQYRADRLAALKENR